MSKTRQRDRLPTTIQRGRLPTTVLRDTRERRPWTFDGVPIEIRDVTLSTGDYTVPSFCRYDPDRDTYHPLFAVERKAAQDFLTAITWERDRFERELRRASRWPRPLAVVVETSWERLLENHGCMTTREVQPAQVEGTVEAWDNYYNVEWYFAGTRRRAERCALLLLVRHHLFGELHGRYL